jgi:hypothetical protein
MDLEVSQETLAWIIHAVGPGALPGQSMPAHFRDSLVRGITHQLGPDGKYRDPRQVAIEKVDWIRRNHQPEPLAQEKRAELKRILAAADKELHKG